jgi:hypothetical protein
MESAMDGLPTHVQVDVRRAVTRLVRRHPHVAQLPPVAALLNDTAATQPSAALWSAVQTLLLQVRHPRTQREWLT